MLNWFSANLGTIVTGAAVMALLVGVVGVMIKDKKRGRSPCGGCTACAMRGGCPHAK